MLCLCRSRFKCCIVKCCIVLGLAFTLSACVLFQPDETRIDVRIMASAELNPDINLRPSPVVLRMYALTSPSVFENSAFFSIYAAERETLGTSLSGSEEFEMRPGEIKHLKLTVSPDARFVAFLTAYRDIDHASWRRVAPIEPGELNRLQVVLESNGMAEVRGQKGRGWQD